MASTTDASKKHRIRSKNEVVQLNDFFEELNEEYEEELRMRQNSGASVDETALLGDREIPFQFEDEDDESESVGDDSASDTGSQLSESDNALSDSAIDPALGKRRSRGSSDVIKRKESLGTIKITTVKPDSTSAANSDTASTAVSTSNHNDATPNTPTTQHESPPTVVSKEDAVAAVQRSTSFVGNQASRPSIVNKLKSFWESTASPSPVPQTLTRTTSVVNTAAAPATRPASASVSSPTSLPPLASHSAAAPVKKWAPVDARPAMAMAISVPGDRSTVPKEAPSANMVRTTSVIGFSGRSTSPLTRTQSVAPALAQSHHVPSEHPSKTDPVPVEHTPSVASPSPADATAVAAAEPHTAQSDPQPDTQPVHNNHSEETVVSRISVPEPKIEETVPVSPRARATPRSEESPSQAPNGVAHTELVSDEPINNVNAKSDEKDTNSDQVDLAEAANLAVSTVVEDSPQAEITETQKPKLGSTPVSPTKPRRGTKGDSDRRLEKSQSEVPSTKTSAELNETPTDKKKRRGSDKRRAKTDSAANDSGAEDSTREKDKKLRRPKKTTESEEDIPQPKEGADVIVEPAEVKSKKRRKKLTSTTPGGTPTKRSSSTKKIKKSSSVAPDVPKTEATADAQRDAALASAGVAPKEIDKLKQFFSTWNSKDLMHTWEIDPTEIEFVERIGEGTSCSVYRGTYRGQEVALKVLKDINQKQLTNFTKEFDIISQFRSPYVVFFFGACIEPIPVMVLGFCRKGSLFHVLNNPAENITWDLVLKICLQTLRGLDSLHNWRPQIVHRDLKSRNILVEDDWNTKLCDFGESRYTQGTNLETLCKVRGTYAYIAPEVYFGQSFTTKSDVYAFGVILWELCNRCVKGKYDAPFSEYKSLIYDFQIIVQASRKGLRPTIDPKVPQGLQNMIRVCWDHEPDNRPDTASILRFFEEIIAEPNQKKWLEVKHAPVYPPVNGVGKPGAAPKPADEKK